MALADIKKHIKEEEKKEISRVQKENKALLKAINTALQSDLDAQKNNIQASFEREKARLKAKAESKTHEITLQAIEGAKMALIDEVITSSLDELVKDSKKVIPILLKRAKEQIKVARIYCRTEDKSLFKDIPTEPIICKGGFIAQDTSAKVRVDYRFETILQDKRSELLTRVAEALFK